MGSKLASNASVNTLAGFHFEAYPNPLINVKELSYVR